MMSLKTVVELKHLPKPQARILTLVGQRLARKGVAGYIVGGLPRDLLLGEPTPDVDIVVDGIDPVELAGFLHKRHGFSRPVMFRRFNTVLTVRDGTRVEISKLHRDIVTDAGRRDFTVNSLYIDLGTLISDGSAPVLDPTGRGRADLRARVLVTPRDVCCTMWLDPIRILRGIRFYATLGFSVDPEVIGHSGRLAFLLTRVSVERIRGELELILLSRRLRSSLRLMQRTGVVDVILPEFGRTHRFAQSTPYHAYDLFTHSIRTAANTRPDLNLRLAGLLHDLGKIDTRSFKGDRAVYYGHQEVSTDKARSVLTRLRFPRRITDHVCFLIRNHMINYSRKWSDRAIRRFVRKMGDSLDDMLALVEADMRAQRPGPGGASRIGDLRERIGGLRDQGAIHLNLPVDGRDIMRALGIKEGPAVGMAKDFLMERAAGRRKPLTRAQCTRLLREWIARHSQTGSIDVDKVRAP
jgi:putative nucleotidyltransferase with HDIG domain